MSKTRSGFHRAKYKVIGVDDSIKCWTILNLEGGGHISVMRTSTNRGLLGKLEGNIVEVVSSDSPPGSNGNSVVASVDYLNRRFYPVYSSSK